jgi:hypothetical protein
MANILQRTNKYILYMAGIVAAFIVTSVYSAAAYAQADLGQVAQQKATGAVGDAVLVAGVIIGFAVLYKIIRKVTGS